MNERATKLWDRAAQSGEAAVNKMLNEFSKLPTDIGGALGSAAAFGALREASRFLKIMTKKGSQAVIEKHALGIVRGSLRGAEGPIGEDGLPL